MRRRGETTRPASDSKGRADLCLHCIASETFHFTLSESAIGAQQSARALIGNSRFPCFADLHHHDLSSGKPPEGQLDRGEGNEGGQGFGKILEALGETPQRNTLLGQALRSGLTTVAVVIAQINLK